MSRVTFKCQPSAVIQYFMLRKIIVNLNKLASYVLILQFLLVWEVILVLNINLENYINKFSSLSSKIQLCIIQLCKVIKSHLKLCRSIFIVIFMFNKYVLFVGPLIGVFNLTFVGAPMNFWTWFD